MIRGTAAFRLLLPCRCLGKIGLRDDSVARACRHQSSQLASARAFKLFAVT